MALYSLFKLTALCALFQAAAAAGTPACSGTRTETYQPSSPDGVYSQNDIDVYGTKVKHIDVVFHPVCPPATFCLVPLSELITYKMDLEGCVIVGDMCMPFPGEMHKTFNDGRFIDSGNNQGAMFIPRSSEPLNPINELLKIQWCPDQNYFLVKLAGQLLKPLRHQATVFSTVSPLADTSGPVEGSTCDPYALGTCGSSYPAPSGLECTCPKYPPGSGVGPVCIIGTCQRIPIEGSVCDKNAVGTCGSGFFPSSGLSCKCEVFGSKETCKCKP